MGRMSFTQELKALAKASEGMDAGGCWREVIFLHRELGRHENALGRAAWMMRYGQRGEWRPCSERRAGSGGISSNGQMPTRVRRMWAWLSDGPPFRSMLLRGGDLVDADGRVSGAVQA